MSSAFDFEKLGKKNPYPVPDGFFETITSRTLEKAKKRERQLKTRRIVVVFSAAASFLILVLAGTMLLNQGHRTKTAPMVEIKATDTEMISDSVFEATTSTNPTQETKAPVVHPQTGNTKHEESIDDLLAEMDDTELMQIAEMLAGELFVDELTND